MKIAHVEASNVVSSLMTSQLCENVPEKVAGKPPKGSLLENLPREKSSRLNKTFSKFEYQR